MDELASRPTRDLTHHHPLLIAMQCCQKQLLTAYGERMTKGPVYIHAIANDAVRDRAISFSGWFQGSLRRF